MSDGIENTEQDLAASERIASMLAHEINNLMAPVLGRAQLALRDLSDTAAAERALSAAVVSAQQASEIASALLETYASPDAHAGCLLPLAVDRAVLLTAPPRGVSVEYDLGAASDVVVPGAVTTQILINLLRNAIAAIEQVGGRGEVEVVANVLPIQTRSTWNSPMVSLSVLDTGPGVRGQCDSRQSFAKIASPDSSQSPVLDMQSRHELPAQQVKQHTRSGYGLGLEVCRQLAQSVSGSIELADRPDVPGAIATFLIPCSLSTMNAA